MPAGMMPGALSQGHHQPCTTMHPTPAAQQVEVC
eukprot:COSAG05_NODE_12435_length_468_cov_0.804878_1_plen_33_part_10